MLKSKVMGENLSDAEMKDIYGSIGCNCLPGCDCTPQGVSFSTPFEKHDKRWSASFYGSIE